MTEIFTLFRPECIKELLVLGYFSQTACVHKLVAACLRRSEDNLWASVSSSTTWLLEGELSICHVSPK